MTSNEIVSYIALLYPHYDDILIYHRNYEYGDSECNFSPFTRRQDVKNLFAYKSEFDILVWSMGKGKGKITFITKDWEFIYDH